MNIALKSCSVLLYRNEKLEEKERVNYSDDVDADRESLCSDNASSSSSKDGETIQEGKKIKSSHTISEPRKLKSRPVLQNRNKKLRKKERVNYSDDVNAERESSCSDNASGSSSEDGETIQEDKKIKNSRTVSEPKKPRSSSVLQNRNERLRKKDRVNYSDDVNAERESACSDGSGSSSFSDASGSSSEDEETVPEGKKIKNSHTISEPKQLKCLLCEKSFTSHPSYLTHKRSHEIRPFKCIICIKKFENRQSFINHMKADHPEVLPFLCEYPRCDKNFKTLKQRNDHHKSHWKYMCKYCKKLFLRKHHMRKHVNRIHLN